MEFKNKAYGSILGAFVGDSAGSVLEFFGSTITQDDVDNACTFPGGGMLGVKPGQLTDDSEMAMSLMHGIIDSENNDIQQPIAKRYVQWSDSKPIDVGNTTTNAVCELRDYFLNGVGTFDESIKNIAEFNIGSKSNGCLMRITPLAVYLHHLNSKHEKIEEYTKLDLALTHSNETCLVATTAYVIAIVHLLNSSNDVEGALAAAESYINQKENEDVSLSWKRLTTAKSETELIKATKHIGYAIIAFEYAFYYLKQKYDYQDAIKAMLLKGGDTDTNAAIVGGLVGARVGVTGIPKAWRDAVLNADTNRPKWLQPQGEQNFIDLVNQLLAKSDELKS